MISKANPNFEKKIQIFEFLKILTNLKVQVHNATRATLFFGALNGGMAYIFRILRPSTSPYKFSDHLEQNWYSKSAKNMQKINFLPYF